MYNVLDRSNIDYCDIIYHGSSQQNQQTLGITLNPLMENVERILCQAALAVTGTRQGSSHSKLFEELGWETLSDRRRWRRILQVYKMSNDKTASYLLIQDPCLVETNVTPSMNWYVDQIGTWTVFWPTQLPLGT